MAPHVQTSARIFPLYLGVNDIPVKNPLKTEARTTAKDQKATSSIDTSLII
jgi:hypothetical protein